MPMKNPPTTTHQQKQVAIRNGKPIFYEPDDLAAARSKLMSQLGQHVPIKKYQGAIQCTVKWFFHSDRHKDGEWKTTKPDTHNMNKLLFDVMTDLGYWKDDNLVVSEHIQKFWVNGSPPGIFIRIEEV